ncbi:MAG: hypothetical protein MI723_10830 [Caulobacterales bacterium]|nr:hypothetical protein [Caulobacterales bacterium]
MQNADYFYPGFELAGLETPADRALTWTLCALVMSASIVAEIVGDVFERLGPVRQPVIDG